MPDAVLLVLAVACSLLGAGWLALSFDVHRDQVADARSRPVAARPGRLRFQGAIAWLAALLLCLAADHASIAVLAWVMSLSAASVLVAFVLAWRPGWLGWVGR